MHETAADTGQQTTPMQVSFIYPLGTNGIESVNISYKVSLNIFAGVNGGVDVVKLAGFSNVNKGDVKGV